MKLLIIGSTGGAHIGGSLARAANRSGFASRLFDISQAFSTSRVLNILSWQLNGRKPAFLNSFGNRILAACQQGRPDALITTGIAPLARGHLSALRALGVRLINYSTDDPWNPNHRADWFFRALPLYDVVYTTRQSNIADLERLGCDAVRYLPFGYDDDLFHPPESLSKGSAIETLFIGGADHDRAAFIAKFLRCGLDIKLVGGYWERFSDMKPYACGLKPPEEICALTAAAKVNICLVRRANRDGHVMRSFEIPAIGGVMIAEDTPEHRMIFGDEGQCTLYFRTPEQAAGHVRGLLTDGSKRDRLARAAHKRIVEGRNTYRDRLMQMLEGLTGSSLPVAGAA